MNIKGNQEITYSKIAGKTSFSFNLVLKYMYVVLKKILIIPDPNKGKEIIHCSM